jgi:uncharacterized protein YbbK (DUF523 family)/uncharacterized protein YbgA (DUF1722 family)
MATAKPRLGVSACLLGRKVRWDGQHRRDPFLVDVLGPFVEWVPVCPEQELGLGVPREPIRLVGSPAAPRLLAERSGKDHTEAMRRLAEGRVRELAALDLSGYVTKQDSPSCGLLGVRVHGARGGPPRRAGVGAFAAVLLARLPMLPVEEEGRLQDPAIREGFVERIFAYARWKAAVGKGMRRGDLLAFHAAHELALRAHSPAAWRTLTAAVDGLARGPTARAVEAYGRGFMEALRIPATRGRHASVLERMLRSVRDVLPAPDRIELAGVVADYARGRAPLVVALTLFRHHARRHAAGPRTSSAPRSGAGEGVLAWLAGQTYLDPDPRELLLRNRA